MLVPGYVYRQMAVRALKSAMSVLVVVMLIVLLPEMINVTVSQLTGALPLQYLKPATDKILDTGEAMQKGQIFMTQAIMDMESAMIMGKRALETFWQEKGAIFVGLWALQLLMTPVLQLGLINALLMRLRFQDVSYLVALSRMGCFFKAVGVSALTSVKTVLWTLPGMAVMVASTFLPLSLVTPVYWVGMALAVVLGVRAAYCYALAPYFLADHPDMGVFRCVRRSVEVMKGRRMELFSLEMSFLWLMLLVSLVEGAAYGMLGNVLGMTVGMMLNLLLQLYVMASKTAFYEMRVVRAEELERDVAAARARMEAEMARRQQGQDEDDLN